MNRKCIVLDIRSFAAAAAWPAQSLAAAVGILKRRRLRDWQILIWDGVKRKYREPTVTEDAKLQKLGAWE